MQRFAPGDRVIACAATRTTAALLMTALLLISYCFAPRVAAQAPDAGYAPASGRVQVIAQGVVPLPQGDVLWRTVRTRAAMPADAAFEERPLGFVFASTGPLLLVDRPSGEQMRLGTGEAALVHPGAMQQRSSLSDQPVAYLSIELVPVDAPPPGDNATVLAPGQPFPAPVGLHDFDLLSGEVVADETFTIPDSGTKNVILITGGAASLARPGAEPVVLIAGEAASFSGALQVAAAPADASADVAARASFLVAMIGPEIAPPEDVSEPPQPMPTEAAAAAATASASGAGSIAIEVFTCPPGMTAETLAAAACAPAVVDFDVTLSGENLDGPLTLGDAQTDGDAFVWSGLPYGDYLIAEAVMPTGFSTYVLAAPNTSGAPDTGYRLTLGPDQPRLSVRIYNFAEG
jgi:hypothetical protein